MTCPVCGGPVEHPTTGRRRTYCSSTCRLAAMRRMAAARRRAQRPTELECRTCAATFPVQPMGKLPLYCSSTCSRRWFARLRRGEPGSDVAFAEWQAERGEHRQLDEALRALHQAQTRCVELGLPVAATDAPVEPSPDAFRCVCGDLLEEVPNPPWITDAHAKWTQAGWCDSCTSTGRGFVIVTTRRPMRLHEEEQRARHTLEVTR